MSTRIEALEARSRPPSPLLVTTELVLLKSPAPYINPIVTLQLGQEDKRWRLEEIGEFNSTGDITAFIDRIKTVVANKSVRLVQTNIVTLLKKKAFNWYHYEMEKYIQMGLNSSISIDLWCQALGARFKLNYRELITQLETTQYTRKDAVNKKDATEYV